MKLEKRIAVSFVLLLVCLVLVVSASYAWYSFSRLPEVSGIETNVGANGTLEIALLNDETYLDPSQITTTVGGSLAAQDALISNLQWGNVIDLSDPGYGLEHISLLPAQLNISAGADGQCTVKQNMLALSEFGMDGRVTIVDAQSVSAVYRETDFLFSTQQQSYGVRAIGEVGGMTMQQTALANARSAVASYQSAAAGRVKTAWADPGIGKVLVELYHRHYAEGINTVDDEELYAIRGMATDLNTAYGYVESALRQSVVGYAAAYLEDEQTFQSLRMMVENEMIPLSVTLDMAAQALPSTLKQWVTGVENAQTEMGRIIRDCQALSGKGGCTWDQIESQLFALLDGRYAYFGEELLSKVKGALPEESIQLLLQKNAGATMDITSYVGDYQLYIACGPESKTLVQVRTLSDQKTSYLTQIHTALTELSAVGTEDVVGELPLVETYGYAIDMAFRCNAATQLLLQTAPSLRVNETNDELLQTQGGGSYMRFDSDTLTADQVVLLMDAIRVGLMDNQNRLVAVAKLNTSNYIEGDDGISAPLYLYDFTPSLNDGILMGERREDDNVVMDLPANAATILTAVVWLDGEWMDNSLAAATVQSVNGVLNLQFASSADLVSADLSIANYG